MLFRNKMFNEDDLENNKECKKLKVLFLYYKLKQKM